MSVEFYSHTKSYRAAADLDAYVIVAKDGDKVKLAAVTDTPIGATSANVKTGDLVTVRLFNAGGTTFVKLGGDVAINAELKVGAGGKAVTDGDGAAIGTAEQAGTADDVIEALTYSTPVPPVEEPPIVGG
ncbi:MAG: hypothetical protein LBK99_16435 [Opitutaceae bacterium]|jgi:hypothetical protein|nr:hypothetical protein [Opitutaceae bacterium]